MSLQIIKGRSGRGKTTKLFQILQSNLDKKKGVISSKKFLIVPDQYSYSMEKRVMENFDPSTVFNIQIMGLSMLTQRILEWGGGIKRKLISPVGRSMLIRRIIRENSYKLNIFSPMAEKPGFVDMMGDIIKELKTYGRKPSDIEEAIAHLEDGESKEKLKDILVIFKSYENVMDKEYSDGEERLELAIERFNDAFSNIDAEFYIDAYTNFTPLQYKLLGKMIAKHDTYITLTMDENTGSDHKGPFSLTKFTEEKLLNLVREYSLSPKKDIFVTQNEGRFSNPEISLLERKYYSLEKPEESLKGVKGLRIVKADSPHEELQFVAKDIISKVKNEGLRFKDIAILMRNIEDYEGELNSIMLEYGIPIFTDNRKTMENNPLFSMINAFFDIDKTFYSHESVFRFLKSGITSLENEEICLLETYCLENGISHGAYLYDEWKYSMRHRGDEKETIENIKKVNIYKNTFTEPYQEAVLAMEEATNVREMAEVFYQYLVDEAILDRYEEIMKTLKEEDLQKYNEFRQTADTLMDVLDQMVEILGDLKLSIEEFGEVLLQGIASVRIASVPATLDQVTVGDVSRIKSSGAEAVYIVGVNDGVLPKNVTESGILNEDDRSVMGKLNIGISPGSIEGIMNEDYYTYAALTSPKKLLTISYPTKDRLGESLRPSSLIYELKNIFRYLKIEEAQKETDIRTKDDVITKIQGFRLLAGQIRKFSDIGNVEPFWKGLYGYYRDEEEYKKKLKIVEEGILNFNSPSNVNADNLENLFGKNINLTVSRAETYNKCPFSYFVKYGLKAKDRLEHLPEKYDSGNLKHVVLDKLTHSIDGKWDEMDDETISKKVDELIDRVIREDENSVFLSTSQLKYQAERIKRSLKSSVKVISHQIRNGGFKPLESEVVFGKGEKIPAIEFDFNSLEGFESHRDKKIFITGKIDRVDILNLLNRRFARIIDYKSTPKTMDLNEVLYGTQMQLLVYLDVVLRNEKAVIEILKKKDEEVYSNGKLLPGAIFYVDLKRHLIEGNEKDKLSEEEVFKEAMRKSPMSGLIINEEEVIKNLDRSSENLVTKVKFKNDGNVTKASENFLLSEEDFDTLREYSHILMKDMAKRLLKGEIPITPIKKGGIPNCKYCNYKSICRFDPSLPENEYNIIIKREKLDAIDEMKKRIKEESKNE